MRTNPTQVWHGLEKGSEVVGRTPFCPCMTDTLHWLYAVCYVQVGFSDIHPNTHTFMIVMYTHLCVDSRRRVTQMTATGQSPRLIPALKVTLVPGEQCQASIRTLWPTS